MPSPRFEQLSRTVDLFKGIDPEDVEKIFTKGRTMNAARGTVIFYEGTTGNQMFIVLGGKISLYKEKKPLAELRTGDMFGEMALVSHEPRSASAVAAEDSVLFILEETLFDKLLTKRVAVRMLLNIIGVLCRRLRDTNARAMTT